METNENKECQQLDIHSALYWQKKYLELEADCKDFFSVICNAFLDRGTTTEPIMIEFNDEKGYLSSALDIIRDSGFWKNKDKRDSSETNGVNTELPREPEQPASEA